MDRSLTKPRNGFLKSSDQRQGIQSVPYIALVDAHVVRGILFCHHTIRYLSGRVTVFEVLELGCAPHPFRKMQSDGGRRYERPVHVEANDSRCHRHRARVQAPIKLNMQVRGHFSILECYTVDKKFDSLER